MWLVLPSALCPSAQATAGSTSELTSQQAGELASSATSRGRLMQPRYWQRAWKRGTWIRRLSGVTCEPSTADDGVERWISSLRDSLVSRSARPANDSGSRTSAGSGPTSTAFSARFDPDSCSWKTSQTSLELGCPESSVTWPLSGWMRNGRCYERQTLERPISGDGCLFLPTPTARDWKGPTRHGGGDHGGPSLPSALGQTSRILNPRFVEWMMGLPLGWSSCDSSATESSHSRQPRRGADCGGG
jgi:hypothetical protein